MAIEGRIQDASLGNSVIMMTKAHRETRKLNESYQVPYGTPKYYHHI
jgi:hypothetical protein